ncbi:MAG: hypothetical protein IB618_01825 [Candidatus Pacearchaeota archaeon]|nr:MAG: hypothetical protein IB618_01825 [Candidatus Pacearchaeota archaeon]
MKAKQIKIDGKTYKLLYLNSIKHKGCSISGLVDTKKRIIKINKSRSPSVKRYVLAHEIYHVKDKGKWGGTLGAETRATFYCGLRDPIGMFKTAFTGNIFKGIKNFFKIYIFK